jgi:exopolysaccharide production protein ExoQ
VKIQYRAGIKPLDLSKGSLSFKNQIQSTRSMKPWLDKFEKVFAVCAIAYHTNCFLFLLSGNLFVDLSVAERELPQTSPLVSLVQWTMYAMAIVLGGLRWQKFLTALIKRKLIWVVILLAFISLSWTIVPEVTLRRAMTLLMITILGMYIAFRFTVREQLFIVACALGSLGVINLLFTLVFPTYATEIGFHKGNWRGLLPQKNQFGRLMVLSSISFYILIFAGQTYRKWAIAGLVLSVGLVVLSGSATALLVLGLLFLFIPLCRIFKLKNSQTLPFLIGLLLFGLLVTFILVGYWEIILRAMGRDPNLTGRTVLWQALLDRIGERLWFGYGYQSFWPIRDFESLDVDFIAGENPHSHNGYIELLLDLGLAGFIPFMLSLFMSFSRAITWLRLNPFAEGVWPIAFLTYLLLYNLTESSLIAEPTNIFWFMYSFVSTAILIQPIKCDR